MPPRYAIRSNSLGVSDATESCGGGIRTSSSCRATPARARQVPRYLKLALAFRAQQQFVQTGFVTAGYPEGAQRLLPAPIAMGFPQLLFVEVPPDRLGFTAFRGLHLFPTTRSGGIRLECPFGPC